VSEGFPDESGNAAIQHAVITVLLVFDDFPQPFEGGDGDAGGGLKRALINVFNMVLKHLHLEALAQIKAPCCPQAACG
jgi:hypothetical protein